MLRAVGTGSQLVVCSTCRTADARADGDARRPGALLAEALRRVRDADPDFADPPFVAIAVEEMPCLFACGAACAVHVRAAGKIGYVLGGFIPDDDAARALLTYAARHAASEEGVVPYGQWPEGVKGHFIVRVPPEGFVAT